MLLASMSDHAPYCKHARVMNAEHSADYIVSYELLQRLNTRLSRIDNSSMMSSSTPLQHVTQVDDKCARNRLYV